MKKRDVVNVYGTGANALKYIYNNSDKIVISCVIEGRKEKAAETRRFLGKDVLWVGDANKKLRENYTVVATSPVVYLEIKRVLEEEYGLIEYENFEYFETYGKRIAVLYGNCHLDYIKSVLNKHCEFTRVFGMYPIPAIQDMKKLGFSLESLPFDRISLFVHQCIWKKNIYGTEFASDSIVPRLNNSCKVIGVPNLYRMPKYIYPQIPTEFDQIYYREFGDDCFFIFRDKYLDENKDSPLEDLVDMIEDDQLIRREDILEEEEKFFERLRMRENGWDIKIEEYLRKSIKEKQCFYEPNHPCGVVMQYIVREVLRCIGLNDKNEIISDVREMDMNELPIYASVRKALGLSYSPERIRKSGSLLCGRAIDKKEYVKQYLFWNHVNINECSLKKHIIYMR